MTNRGLAGLVIGFLSLFVADQVPGGPISGELFYTKFSGAPNVKKVSFTYDGSTTFSLGTPVSIGTTFGADGIAGNPQNSDLLIVGGQGPRMNTISISTGAATAFASPGSIFHLAVTDPTTIFGSGIPGAMARHGINPDGSLTAGTFIPISGSDTVITQLISTPAGFFYTSSGAGGFGSYGSVAFNTGNPKTATAATTSRIHTALPAAHGGVYDPFSNSVIIMGDDHVTQINLAGTIISNRNFLTSPVGGVNPAFDQGAVDGNGHLFVASNSGHLLFMDYSATGLTGNLSNFAAFPFLDTSLDDIAPLIGPGGTANPVPEPSSIVLLGMGGLALFGNVWRRRRVNTMVC